FETTDGDIILQSSDKVQFRVFKNILSLVSPFFHNMFTLPSQADQPQVQVVECTEDGRVLQVILQCCYPPVASSAGMAAPKIKELDLDLTWRCLEATIKFELETVQPRFEQQFGDLCYEQPLACFAISTIRGWKEHAKKTADLLLQIAIPFGSPVKELDGLAAFDFHRLISYHICC
ncbi:hypothetical protein FA15DRAFT_546270, partial [Coprinopsis marcescibilis]